MQFTTFSQAAQRQPPHVAIVLGSGLGDVARRVQPECSISFNEVPGLDGAGVAGHKGAVTLGAWAGRRVLLFEGRLHFYEGHAWEKVVRPIQLAKELGARVLLLTNAAGGIHDDLWPGSCMALLDHLEWTRPYAWRQPGPGAIGAARPSPYSRRLLGVWQAAAAACGTTLLAGTYAQVTGPCYETPAEIRALKAWGADAVGMSTTREIQAGFDLGMECAALSCITNRGAGLSSGTLHHGEVLAAGKGFNQIAGDLLENSLRLLGDRPC
jgi:purine-nucleoside phosphorylase